MVKGDYVTPFAPSRGYPPVYRCTADPTPRGSVEVVYVGDVVNGRLKLYGYADTTRTVRDVAKLTLWSRT